MAALAVFPSTQRNDDVEHFVASQTPGKKMVNDLSREAPLDQVDNLLVRFGLRVEPILQVLVQSSGRTCERRLREGPVRSLSKPVG